MKVGDLVKSNHSREPGVGIVLEVGLDICGVAQEPPAVRVLWRDPIWHLEPAGGSLMYEDELVVISEGR